MNSDGDGTVTRLLDLIRAGDKAASGDLLEAAYEDLRQVATALMRSERSNHTLQPTALLHEAVVRLVKAGSFESLQNRPHFFAAVARAMRQILIEHARRRATARKGGSLKRVPLDDVLDHFKAQNLDIPCLHDALDDLGNLNARQRQVVELRFFWGFTVEDVARELGISKTTAEGEFRKARAYLRNKLGTGIQPGE